MNLCRLGSCFSVCLQVYAVSHPLIRAIQDLLQRRVQQMQNLSHGYDFFSLEIGTFEEFATAVPQRLAMRAKTCYHHVITFKKIT